MVGLDAALYSSLGALQASTLGLATVNHNIANVNTPGFSRQIVNLSASLPVPTGVGTIGTGVQIDSITSFRDRFLESRLVQENSSSGKFSTLSDGLQQLETIFNETTSGALGQAINKFFNVFSDVANDPSLPSARSVLVQQGKVLANNFNSVSGRLASLQVQTDRSVATTVQQVNDLATQIADLNLRITTSESSGEAANDLRDARTKALQDLGRLVSVNSYEELGGSVAVNIGAGRSLVSGKTAKVVSTQAGSNGLTQVIFNGADITAEITNGTLAGTLQTRDSAIPDAQAALDDLAAKIVSQVNTVHRAGTGLDGSTGNDFFVPLVPAGGSNAGAARAFAVSNTIANNPDKVAASLSGAVGANANAIALANLQNQSFTVTGGTGTFAELYGRIVAQVGALSQSAQVDGKVQDAVLAQAQKLRDSVSGVSLDEEAVNLIKFQRSYQSSARVIRIVSDLLEEAINLVR